MTFEAILFDCDGVLVDTEQAANDAMAALVSNRGNPTDGRAFRKRFQGRTLTSVAEELALEMSKAPTGTELEEAVLRKLEQDVVAIPDVQAVIHRLHESNVNTCVASSGTYDKMKTTLGITGLEPLFKHRIFSATEVAKGKPAPDIFNFAMRKMNWLPEQTVIIEDSLSGIKAGIAAHCTVFAYCGDPFSSVNEARDAGAIPFEAMTDLPDLLYRHKGWVIGK